MKAITIANDNRILKKGYGFFMTKIVIIESSLHSLVLSLITILKM